MLFYLAAAFFFISGVVGSDLTWSCPHEAHQKNHSSNHKNKKTVAKKSISDEIRGTRSSVKHSSSTSSEPIPAIRVPEQPHPLLKADESVSGPYLIEKPQK